MMLDTEDVRHVLGAMDALQAQIPDVTWLLSGNTIQGRVPRALGNGDQVVWRTIAEITLECDPPIRGGREVWTPYYRSDAVSGVEEVHRRNGSFMRARPVVLVEAIALLDEAHTDEPVHEDEAAARAVARGE